MTYEIRNQNGNVPYVPGLKEEIISIHLNGRTNIKWDGSDIEIIGHKVQDGKMTINVYIEGI